MLYFRHPDVTATQGVEPVIILAHDGLDIPPYSDAELFPRFQMETYAKISKKNQTAIEGNQTLKHINMLLAEFTPEEQRYIYQYFVRAKRAMNKLNTEPDAVQTVASDLTAMTSTVMSQLQFAEKAIALVEKTMELPDLSYVGIAAHYTKEFSFFEKDYYDLTAMCMLCKFMCPIWGEFISRMKQVHTDPKTRRDTTLIDERNNKEIFCSTMITPYFESSVLNFEYLKLYGYMINIVKQGIKRMEKSSNSTQPPIDFVMAKYGYDMERFHDYVCSMLLVKRIVGFDPWQLTDEGKPANIVTHTNVVIDKTTLAHLKRMRAETGTLTRNDVSDGGNEPDNISFTDNYSRISSMTADVPIVVAFGVNKEIPRLLAREGLDPRLFETVVAYNLYKQVRMSVFNIAIVTSLNTRWIGGSALVRLLDAETYCRLLTYTQLHLLKMEQYQLAAYLTCYTGETTLERIRPEGHRIINNTKATYEYDQIIKLFPGSAEKQIVPYGIPAGTRSNKRDFVEIVNIVGQIERIQSWIIEYPHVTVFAPILLEQLPSEWRERIMPDEALQYDEKIIRELCTFFLVQHGGLTTAA